MDVFGNVGEKRCRKCGEVKPLKDFYRMKGMRHGHRNECKVCNLAAKKARYDADPKTHIERVRSWRERNPDRYDAYRRQYQQTASYKRSFRRAHLKSKYGITLEEYERRLAAQGGGCAICGDPPPDGGSLHVDHDHGTGRVRALLCMRCNNGLGLFRDDPELLERALMYVTAKRRAAALASGGGGDRR